MEQPLIPTLCMICGQTLKGDIAYLKHMETVHGTNSPDQAITKEKAIQDNTPKQAPVILNKEVPPTPEFMEIARMMDQPPPPVPVSNPPVMEKPKEAMPTVKNNEIILKYKYEGNCPTCNTPIRTIVVKANGQTVAVALCLDHGEVKQHEVPDLNFQLPSNSINTKTNVINIPYPFSPQRTSSTAKIRKGGKKYGKRQSKLLDQNAVQSTVPTS